jgi:lipid-A-disaccharide synthase
MEFLMRLFLSAGEPSGDLHGSNFIKALRDQLPNAQVTGFGGPKLASSGQEQLFPLAEYAIIGLWRVLAALPQFYRFFKMATRELDARRPDAVILIDYPGFHWHLAKAAHQRGIPVFWLVPPQIWAWASHRVKRMQKWVDHVFCNLPFETEWYRSRGVRCSFIGHPYFDALARQQLDGSFLASQRKQSGRLVALLPGSRTHEVRDNFPQMLQTAELIHAAVPQTRFLVAGYKEQQAAWMRERIKRHPGLPVEIHLGKTPEIIHLSEVCLAVSGSVSLELLNACLPTVTLYKIGPVLHQLVRIFKHAKHISLINLLSEEVLSPEFLTRGDESQNMAPILIHWLQNENERCQVAAAMQQLRNQVARPGACKRAVEHMLAFLKDRQQAKHAA